MHRLISLLPKKVLPATTTTIIMNPVRSYSYYKSRTEESPDKYTAFDKSYAEWKFVEKLIPPVYVADEPPSSDPSIELPSGWKPPNPPQNCSYLIRRTKNHLIPVYCHIEEKGYFRETRIKRVEGNIWQLERDIGAYLQQAVPKAVIVTRTYEVSRLVTIKGDYKDLVMQWVKDQGF